MKLKGVLCLLLALGLFAVGYLALYHYGQWRKTHQTVRSTEKAEARAKPKAAEEELVKEYVLTNADDPDSVEFARWGPHDLNSELGIRWPPFGNDFLPTKGVRVAYRANNEFGAKTLRDQIFFIQDGKVVWAIPNKSGDNWKEDWKAFEQLVKKMYEDFKNPNQNQNIFGIPLTKPAAPAENSAPRRSARPPDHRVSRP
jgi:hypothetical protein